MNQMSIDANFQNSSNIQTFQKFQFMIAFDCKSYDLLIGISEIRASFSFLFSFNSILDPIANR